MYNTSYMETIDFAKVVKNVWKVAVSGQNFLMFGSV